MKKPIFPYYLILIFLVLALGIWAAGYSYYRDQKESIKKQAYVELSTIAELKVNKILTWRKERINDAKHIMENPFVAKNVEQFFSNPRADKQRQEIIEWMKTLQEHLQYQHVFLIDAKGEKRLSVPKEKENLGRYATMLVQEAMKNGRIIFSDLHKGESDKDIHIDFVVPLSVERGKKVHTVGAVLLRIVPEQFLYPLIKSWPAPSKSAETLLVRREEDKIVFLNELRHRKKTALTLHFPLNRKDLPAVMAVKGKIGIVEGVDYRNVPVLASLDVIPDSPWFLVSKIDREEIYGLINKRAWFIGIIISSLILAAGFSVGFIRRHQNAKFYQKQYELEHERQLYTERYEHLTRYANDIILLIDRDKKIIDANERALKKYGYSRDELFSMSLRDLRAPETRPLLNGQLKEVEAQNGMVFETLHQRKDGTVFPIEVSSRIIELDGNKYYQSIIRDITERKQVEEELRKHRDHLDELVEKRSSALKIANEQLQKELTERKRIEDEIVRLNEELRHNLVQLKIVNKELEAFSYSVSHDLRAPLRHITGFVKVLQENVSHTLDETNCGYLTKISESAQRMGILIDDLLTFSRVGRAEMEKQSVKTEMIVKEVIQDLNGETEGRDIVWKIEKLPEVYGDLALLRIVFMNLISNALKFSRTRDHVQIEIGCYTENSEYIFSVKDNGVGFDMKYADKLFSVFQRLHRQEDFEGTGIGLANIKRIIYRHGGRTWAEGEVDKGATFYFTLPKLSAVSDQLKAKS